MKVGGESAPPASMVSEGSEARIVMLETELELERQAGPVHKADLSRELGDEQPAAEVEEEESLVPPPPLVGSADQVDEEHVPCIDVPPPEAEIGVLEGAFEEVLVQSANQPPPLGVDLPAVHADESASIPVLERAATRAQAVVRGRAVRRANAAPPGSLPAHAQENVDTDALERADAGVQAVDRLQAAGHVVDALHITDGSPQPVGSVDTTELERAATVAQAAARGRAVRRGMDAPRFPPAVHLPAETEDLDTLERAAVQTQAAVRGRAVRRGVGNSRPVGSPIEQGLSEEAEALEHAAVLAQAAARGRAVRRDNLYMHSPDSPALPMDSEAVAAREQAAILAQAAARGRAVRRTVDAPRFPSSSLVEKQEEPSRRPFSITPSASERLESPRSITTASQPVHSKPRLHRSTGPRAQPARKRGCFPLLDWSRQSLDARALKAKDLALAIREMGARSLWLHDNSIGADGAEEVGMALQRTSIETQIIRLTLGNNGIGVSGLRRMISSCPSALPHLICLNLGLNKLTAEGVTLLTRAIDSGALSQLQELMLGGNAIGPSGGAALADVLYGGETALKKVQLGNCGLGDEGGVALAQAVSSGYCSGLVSLHLNDNGLGPATAIAFGSALREDGCGLTELWLGGNPLTSAGATSLVRALGENTTLKRLWLDYTGADGATMRALAPALCREGCTLDELWLGGNALCDDDVESLASSLGGAASLRKLWLSETNLSHAGCELLLDAALDPACGLLQLWLPASKLNTAQRRALELASEQANGRRARQPRHELSLKLT
mmetsp:Transcript_18213/g.51251  ORF Transcript_18213/g.51251 Transcript_18213/m.51251 type:complete len:787 (-) Transcript_18213:175-2535(-)